MMGHKEIKTKPYMFYEDNFWVGKEIRKMPIRKAMRCFISKHEKKRTIRKMRQYETVG